MRSQTVTALLSIVLVCRGLTLVAADPVDASRHFEAEVRPILIAHCHTCHGPKTQWGNLRLDSRAAILRGGDTGPAVVPGAPDESLLISAVRHLDDTLRMPEEGKLADGQIAALAKWIELGVVYPHDTPDDAHHRDPRHWAFQPPASSPVPDVADVTWPISPIDHFIRQRLEARQITPAAPADKRTLIRRVTYDLTGLPPTPADVEGFVADTSPDAFAKVVDRLLESPGYGAHWGRHWLDVARYADSNGLDENIAHGNAWKYRDYVVASIQQDKPIDQFILEQLAGDLLPYASEAQRHAQLTATGFLSIGPKVLAEPDQAKMRMDIVDEQIDTLGRVFLGMTLGCARCHDHKFDPIDTVDYYGLAGIFQSTKTMDSYAKVARWHEPVLAGAEATAAQERYDAELAAKRQALERLVAAADAAARDAPTAEAEPKEDKGTADPEATTAELTRLRKELADFEKAGPALPSVMGVTEDQVADAAVHIRGDPQRIGAVVPRHTPPVMRGPSPATFDDASSGRLQLARWLVDPRHPLTSRVFVNRVWRWLFGTGLVRTTDNFGLLGEAPSHPELLDWLARRFVADGWSLKSLHRLLLNSRTYQQASEADAAIVERDPDNRLLGRFSIRRLTAEEVRDSLLFVSGQLDPTPGGPVLKVENRGYLFDHTSIDRTDYHSVRRSLYLPVIRNNVFDLFQLLDFPDPALPSGDRATSTVAPQALMMMNSEFVIQAAEALAERLLRESADEGERLARLGALAYGRPLTDVERETYRHFLGQFARALQRAQADPAARARQAWIAFCHTVLATNEFVYVR